MQPSHLATVLLALSASTALHGQDPAFDDFERHDLGPSWTVLQGSNAGIVGNSDLGVPDTNWCFVGWVASSFGADQFSEARISPVIEPTMLVQVYARRRASDFARYGFHWNGDFGIDRWEIKYDGVPTPQTKILASVPGPGHQPGDVLRIEVFGSNPVVIRGYVNGALLLEAADGSAERIDHSGLAGVVSRYSQGMPNDPPTAIVEEWAGGSLHFIDLGDGLAGTVGVPTLSGVGDLAPGTTATFTLSDAFPGAGAILITGAGLSLVPLLGGVLVPSPDLVLSALPVDASGTWASTILWPSALGSGFATNAQVWVPDPGGVQGFAASNGLRITTS